jgi:hypothetical protein
LIEFKAMSPQRHKKFIAAWISAALLMGQLCSSICHVSACDEASRPLAHSSAAHHQADNAPNEAPENEAPENEAPESGAIDNVAIENADGRGASGEVAGKGVAGHCHQALSPESSTADASALPSDAPQSQSHNCPGHDSVWMTAGQISAGISPHLLMHTVTMQSHPLLMALPAPPRIAARWDQFHSPPRIPQRSILRI